MKRTIRQKHQATDAPMGNLVTFRAMPTSTLNHLDPFLFVNHHGPQFFGPDNEGLPFGPHPHRGFETLTFVFKGDLVHWDSSGSKSRITEGGVQWMTAGRGIIHSEISSDEFLKNGGDEEIIQLWLNLPSGLKMTPPAYNGLPKEALLHLPEAEGKATVHLISGKWKGTEGPHQSLTGLTMTSIDLLDGAHLTCDVPEAHQILLYVVHGNLAVNGQAVSMHQLVEFAHQGTQIEMEALEDCRIIFGHGLPTHEPVVAHGPFVMNSHEQIMEAIHDYQTGKMGSWE